MCVCTLLLVGLFVRANICLCVYVHLDDFEVLTFRRYLIYECVHHHFQPTQQKLSSQVKMFIVGPMPIKNKTQVHPIEVAYLHRFIRTTKTKIKKMRKQKDKL